MLDITDEATLLSAYADLSSRLGPQVNIAMMVSAGVELGLGMLRDPQFGALVSLSAGGSLIELLEDRVIELAPMNADEVRRALAKLRIGKLLHGVRGAPPVDIEAVVDAVVKFSCLAKSLEDVIAEMDVNPLVTSNEGVVAVDALAIPVAG